MCENDLAALDRDHRTSADDGRRDDPAQRAARARDSILRRLSTGRVSATARAALSFGAVGLLGMVIDVGLFNLLRLGLLGSTAFIEKPLTAAVLSATAAIVFNWFGNRLWTFRSLRRKDVVREFAEYAAVAVLGLGVSLLCLAFSHYALGQHSIMADNIAKNGVGLGLGTVIRFTLSRWWIWSPARRSNYVLERSGAVELEP